MSFRFPRAHPLVVTMGSIGYPPAAGVQVSPIDTELLLGRVCDWWSRLVIQDPLAVAYPDMNRTFSETLVRLDSSDRAEQRVDRELIRSDLHGSRRHGNTPLELSRLWAVDSSKRRHSQKAPRGVGNETYTAADPIVRGAVAAQWLRSCMGFAEGRLRWLGARTVNLLHMAGLFPIRLWRL